MAPKGKEKLTVKVKGKYADEVFDVDIVCPLWAKHKATGEKPSDRYEEEGGDSMWDLYVDEQATKEAKKAWERRAAKAKAEQAAKERANLASLKESFEVFDGDGNGTLDAEEVVEILTRMTGDGTELSLEDAKEFIAEFDRDGDGFLDVNEFIVAMGVMSDAFDGDGDRQPSPALSPHQLPSPRPEPRTQNRAGDGVADMKNGGTGEYDGKEAEFAEKLAMGEDLRVAGVFHTHTLALTRAKAEPEQRRTTEEEPS